MTTNAMFWIIFVLLAIVIVLLSVVLEEFTELKTAREKEPVKKTPSSLDHLTRSLTGFDSASEITEHIINLDIPKDIRDRISEDEIKSQLLIKMMPEILEDMDITHYLSYETLNYTFSGRLRTVRIKTKEVDKNGRI